MIAAANPLKTWNIWDKNANDLYLIQGYILYPRNATLDGPVF